MEYSNILIWSLDYIYVEKFYSDYLSKYTVNYRENRLERLMLQKSRLFKNMDCLCSQRVRIIEALL